ncbi:MAG TPA: glycoside hydrolase family 3 N-terminal domain-containing protein [Streptosporangiaceae bacterium]|nr:glycoside hydrolase family 3 N-terminal domain-containing protein [Streptosporangiaceae bacterium]
MTLTEKISQLYSTWLESDSADGGVAPHQDDLAGDPAGTGWPEVIRDGLGQLTRPFGTRPVTARQGAETLARLQREIMAASRFGIPAIAHDECLAGFTAWTAAIYPVPLAWGASFDPALVERMAAHIGASMRAVGVHQGLAPVLDVTVDPRWGRTEETIGEDPYLVATVGTAYVRGLESSGLVSTLKHFVGYSASRGGRNLAPAAVTARQIADQLLPPFEMAIRLGGARSVMHAYTDIDGIPTASDTALLSGLLREVWGFTGTVVADYFGISFLELLHKVAAGPAQAAALALEAGVDVELPTVRCFGAPLIGAVQAGAVPEALVDRAAARVLTQKCELGLLDPSWDPSPAALGPAGANGGPGLDLASPDARDLARQLAEESVVLLANDGILPLDPGLVGRRIAVVGPRADDPYAMLGCYSFPSHVGVKYPDLDIGVEIPTFLAALRDEFPGAEISYKPGCGVDDPDRSGLADAVRLAREHDLCVAVLGDRSGLFGRGTSGEGCDAADLTLPGLQGELLHALLTTGTPVVAVLLAGRPYALGPFTGAAAIMQAFFPGQQGGPALARLLSGAVCPSGRLPASVPRHAGAQPTTYLGSPLAQRSKVSSIDPTPLYPFGHGLTYTSFALEDVGYAGHRWEPGSLNLPVPEVPTDGCVEVTLTVRNTGPRPGTEVVQLYLHDPVAQVARPTIYLAAYARVDLEPGQARLVRFVMPTDLTSFTGRHGQRIVEPGRIELRLGRSSADTLVTLPVELTGAERVIDGPRQMTTAVHIS